MSIPTIPYMQFLHSELHLQEILHTSQTSHIYPTSATLTLTGKNVTQQNPVMCNLHEFSTITYPWRSIPPPQKCLYLECLKPKPYQVVPHSIPQPRTSPCREGATKWKKKPLVKLFPSLSWAPRQLSEAHSTQSAREGRGDIVQNHDLKYLGIVAASEEHWVRKLQTGAQDGHGRDDF